MPPAEIIPEHLRELIARHANATIENCARVAEGFPAGHIALQSATAIRKLKTDIDINIIHPGSPDAPGPFPEETK